MKWISNGHRHETTRTQTRKGTQTYTVAENTNILSTFMPEKYRNTKSCEPYADAHHQ